MSLGIKSLPSHWKKRVSCHLLLPGGNLSPQLVVCEMEKEEDGLYNRHVLGLAGNAESRNLIGD